uniref:Peptidase C14 caspase domain-containing protein n=1 Tax=Zooxanthella nutricula TaxID=1333877 RepID=A0A7S2HK95_9DINO
MDFLKNLVGAAQALKQTNQPVASVANYLRRAPATSGDGDVHMLIFALDYKRTSNALTCSMDGRNMEALARACGVTDCVAMYDEQCTKDAAFRAIQQVGARCGDDDYFIIYYSGHGTSVEDSDGDEEDGQDEAFCFVDPAGQISCDTLMTDDEFAECVAGATEEGVRIVILTDCCHSGTIADLEKDEWEQREVVSIAGCLDGQTSGDMGKGGIFTHALLLAIDQLQDAGTDDYSIGMLYNLTLDKDNKVFNSAQDITIQTSRAVKPDGMAWPLIPKTDYKAPLTQAAQQAGGGGTAEEAMQQAMVNPQLLQQLGIKPQLAQFINSSGLQSGEIDVKQFLKAGVECYMAGGCTKDACAIQ